MRIAHLVSTFPPYKGGMGNVCFYQAKELAKLGHQVTVFTPLAAEEVRSCLPHPENWVRDHLSEEVEPHQINFEVKRVKPLIRWGNAALLPKLVKVLKEFDIVHLHYPFFGAAEFIWLARLNFLKKNLGGLSRKTPPLILQYHMDVLSRNIKRLFFGFHNKFTLPRIIGVSDKVIASSTDYLLHSSIKELVKKNFKYFVEIPLGVDTELFYPQEKSQGLLSKYNLLEDDQIILFVGGLDRAHYFKGVDILIKVFAEVQLPQGSDPQKSKQIKRSDSPKKLLIIGQGELKKDYIKLVQEYGVGDSVIFAGEVPQQDLAKYYNLADILVLPSIDQSEAFGLVLLEAAACGKPTIASNLPGVRTVIQNKKTGFLVEPKSVEDLKEKLLYLLNNKSIQEKFGQAGRRRVEEKYTWPKIAKQLDDLYQSFLKL